MCLRSEIGMPEEDVSLNWRGTCVGTGEPVKSLWQAGHPNRTSNNGSALLLV
jgi:hypothetical protein